MSDTLAAFLATKKCNNSKATGHVHGMQIKILSRLDVCVVCAHAGKLLRQKARSERSHQAHIEKSHLENLRSLLLGSNRRCGLRRLENPSASRLKYVLAVSQGTPSCLWSIRQVSIIECHRNIWIGMQEVICLILNESIRFELHTLVRMSTESWPECPDVFFSPSRSSHQK